MDNEAKPVPFEGFASALIDEAKRIQEDALYSAKGHLEAARAWDSWHLRIGIPTAITAAAAGVSALNDFPTVSAVLALLAAATSGVSTFLNPKERAARHLRAGNSYKALQNDARIFSQIECQRGLKPNDLAARLAKLNETRNQLDGESPQIPRGAFEKARKGIEAGEAEYEIDHS